MPKSERDDGALVAVVIIAAVLLAYCTGCSPPKAHAQAVAVAVTGSPIPAALASTRPRAPYRNPQYRLQCRREARISTFRAEAMESKPEARTRARALARAGDIDPVLFFSRIAYGEEGTPRPGRNDNGYEAMLAVLDFRRQHIGGISRVEMFAIYSPRRIFPHPETSHHQAWIAETELNGHRPPSWPRARGARSAIYPTWRDYGCPRWLATIDAVRELFEEHPDDIGTGPCRERPHHWGGDMDYHDDNPLWRQIHCGITEDRFWVVDARTLIEEIGLLEQIATMR